MPKNAWDLLLFIPSKLDVYTIKQQQKTVIHTPYCMLALSLSSFCKLFSQKQSHTWSILQKKLSVLPAFTQKLSTLNF